MTNGFRQRPSLCWVVTIVAFAAMGGPTWPANVGYTAAGHIAIAPSLVTKARVMFLAGNNVSSAYQSVLLPLCQITGPPAQPERRT